jgi:hypothetical protein
VIPYYIISKLAKIILSFYNICCQSFSAPFLVSFAAMRCSSSAFSAAKRCSALRALPIHDFSQRFHSFVFIVPSFTSLLNARFVFFNRNACDRIRFFAFSTVSLLFLNDTMQDIESPEHYQEKMHQILKEARTPMPGARSIVKA